jgi:Ser/Thr protein kinase RdoA (MazF antagonist)
LMDRLRSAPDTDLLTHYYQQLGGIMAAMHTQACAWPLPASFARHRLNADGLMGPAPFWGPFWSHPALSAGERQLLIGTRDQMHGILTRYGEQSDTWSLIHADLHPGNLLLQDDELTVIDFDDAGFGWHQYDIAVALVHYETHPHYAAIEQALLQGYRRQRPLSPAAEAMIPVFRLIRHMVSIGWLYQRPELGRPLSPRYKDAVCAACRAFKG